MNAISDQSMEVFIGADITKFKGDIGIADTHLGRFSKNAEQHLSRFDRAMDRVGGQSTRRFGAGMQRAGRDVAGLTGQLARQQAALTAHNTALARQTAALGGMRTAVLGLGTAFVTLGAARLGGGIIETSKDFEKLQASLKTVTGSAEAGAQAFDMIKTFAGDTPFSLRQATEGFIRLKSLGLDPSREAMESYGNTAAAMSKSLIQYVEAIADATTGEFERLKEFGIKASQAGDQVTFTFQGVSTTVNKTAADIEGFLRQIGNTTFDGAMREQMEGLAGALSNFSDQSEITAVAIGRGGLAGAVAEAARSFSAFMAENEAAAEALGGVLGSAVEGGADALLLLANNADVAAIAVASVLAGRVGAPMGVYTAATVRATLETRALAQQSVALAKAEVVHTRTTQKLAASVHQTALASRAANVSTRTTASALYEVGLAATAAQTRLAAANVQLRALSVSGIAARGAMTALSGTMALFGGPVGFAITAVAVGIGYWATRTGEATLAMQAHESLVDNVSKAYQSADKSAAGWAEKVKAGTVTEGVANLERLQSVLQGIRNEVRAPVDAFGTDTTGVVKQIQNVVGAFRHGRTSAADFRKAIDDIAQANPNLDQSVVLGLLAVGDQAGQVETEVNRAAAALRIIRQEGTEADFVLLGLADAANIAAGGIANSGNAASIAAGQYGTATGAALGYVSALGQLAAAVPALEQATRARVQLAKAQNSYNSAIAAADSLPLEGLRDAAKGLAELSFDAARKEISGFSGALNELEKVEQRVLIDGLEPQARATAQIKQQFAERAKTYKDMLRTGATAAEVNEALARNEKALAKALENSAASFEKKTRGAGGSSKATKDAAKTLEQYRQTVERAAEQEMPWLRAAKEADELRAALAALIATGEGLPEEYVVAVRARLDELDAQVANKTGAEMGEDFGSAFSSGFGDIFKDLFKDGFEDFDDFLDKITSKFADLAFQNIDRLFSGEAFKGQGGKSSGIDADPLSKLGKEVRTGAQGGTAIGAATGISSVFGGGGAGGSGLATGLSAAAGATLGSFSLGYQSGSPIMGGLGGALSGAGAGAAFGIPGMLIGALVGGASGLFGGLFGGDAKLKAKRRQAQKELTGELGAIDQFKQTSYGRGIGDFRGDFTDYQDTSQGYQILARDAGNFGLQKELEDAHSQYFGLLESTFRKERDTAMANLNQGFGFGTAFFSAIDGMEAARDELTGYVDDARFMLDRLRDFGHDLPQGEVNSYISEMEHAAQQYAISLVTGVEPMSDIAERMNEIKGSAVGLEETLIRLAMSSDDAAAAVDNAVNTAMKKLRDDFTDDLGRSINSLNDKGYLNDLADAVDVLETRLADAALLGVSGALALEEFDLAIGQITKSAAEALPAAERVDVYRGALQAVSEASGDAAGVLQSLLMNALTDLAEAAAEASEALAEGASTLGRGIRSTISDAMGIGFYSEIEDALGQYNERLAVSAELGFEAVGAFSELEYSLQSIAANSNLTGGQLSALAEVFPVISDTLGGLVGDGGTSGIADAKAAADQARADLRAAYNAERTELESTITTLQSFVDQISIFKDNLKLDSTLSPLSPLDQLTEAARVYNEVLEGVANGDQDALGRLEQVSRDYLNEARAYYGSSEDYFQIFESVDSALSDALADAQTQISVAEEQLTALETQVGALIDINDSVLSVGDAIMGLDGSLSALAEAQAGQIAAIRELAGLQSQQQAGAINSLYQSLLGRDADQSGLAGWQRSLQDGGTIGDVASGISNSTESAIRNLYLSILGREPDAAGLSGWGAFLRGGGTLDGVAQGILNSPEAARLQIPGMATGGMVTGGIQGVDSVPRMLMPGEYVIPELQTRQHLTTLQSIRAGSFSSNDNSAGGAALLAEVKGLRQEVASLKSVIAAGASANVSATGDVAGAIRERKRGTGLEVQVA